MSRTNELSQVIKIALEKSKATPEESLKAVGDMLTAMAGTYAMVHGENKEFALALVDSIVADTKSTIIKSWDAVQALRSKATH